MSRQNMDEDVRDFLKEHNLVAYADNFQGFTSLSGLLLCAVRSYIMYVHSNAIHYRAIGLMN